MTDAQTKAQELAARLMNLSKSPRPTPPATSTRHATDDGADEVIPLLRRLSRDLDYGRSVRFARWYDGLMRTHLVAADVLSQRPATVGNELGDLERMLLELHGLLLAHPVATKAAFRALVREGRAHTQTPDGHELQSRLLHSSKMRTARLLFRSLSMGLLDDDSSTVLPSAYVDNLLRLIDTDNVEQLLASLGATRGTA